MSGFSFPPPPPPPPRAVPDPTGQDEFQSRGGRSRGRGRGGNYDGLGGGRGGQRGGSGSYARGNGHAGPPSSNTTPANANYRTAGPQSTRHSYGPRPVPDSLPTSLPPGAYINPNFARPPYLYPNAHTATDQKPFHGKDLNHTSPPRTVSGHKRKLDALRPPQHENTKPGPQTAPAVPSFGAPILATKPPSTWASKFGKKSNAWGLNPGNAEQQYFSSDDEPDDDIDEEALYAELGTKLTFEHNGVIMSLSSAADLKAWQDERRRQWPTRARMAEKDAEKWRIGEERKRLLSGVDELEDRTAVKRDLVWDADPQAGTNEDVQPVPQPSNGRDQESKLDRAKRELAEQTSSLQALRKRVADGEITLEKARSRRLAQDRANAAESGISGVDVENLEGEAHESESESEVLSASSVVSSDSDGEQGSDEDAPPEETTSKAPAIGQARSQAPVCKYFAASGHCRDGDACRFRHEARPGAVVQRQQATAMKASSTAKLPVASSSERSGIYQRLLEQQQDEEDRLALQVIRHLGKVGFFSTGSSCGETAR